MGGGHDAEIDLAPVQSADGAELAFLDEAEQLDLHFEREIADFVEEGSAAIGQLDQSLLVLDGAAESALDVAEQLAFHERADQRAAVDGDKLTARVGVVHGPRHHLFAGAALAQQQHRKPVARNLRNEPPQGADLRRLAHQTVSAARREPIHGTPRLHRLHRINSYNEGGGFLT